MYIRTLSGVSDGALGEYQSKAAALQAAEEQLKKYESDCRGIDILKHLRKGKLTTYDETLLLQRRINELPKLFEERSKLDGRARLWQDSPEKNRVFTDPVAERHRIEAFVQRTGALSPAMYRTELAKLLVKLGYPSNYVLGDLETELRRARCEARMNTLRWMGPCSGMEVDDPRHLSRQVADHYVQTELGAKPSHRTTACSVFGTSGFCDVSYSNGITIRVNFSKVPHALIAVQVAPKLGPRREYSYWCSGKRVSLGLPGKTP